LDIATPERSCAVFRSKATLALWPLPFVVLTINRKKKGQRERSEKKRQRERRWKSSRGWSN